jgi:hypothetical protein
MVLSQGRELSTIREHMPPPNKAAIGLARSMCSRLLYFARRTIKQAALDPQVRRVAVQS